MKVQLHVALSAVNRDDTDAFIGTLIVIMLRLNERNTTALNGDVQNWSAGASRFAKAFGIAKPYTKVVNYYLTKGEVNEDAVQELGRIMTEKKSDFDGDNSITKLQFSMLKDLAAHFRFSSESQVVNSWKRLRKESKHLQNATLTSTFVRPDEHKVIIDMKEVKPAANTMRTIYKKFTGTEGSHLNIYQVKKLKETDPKTFEKYSKASKVITAQIKKERERFVRTSGKLLVPIDDLIKHLDSLGVPNNLPRGFIGGQIDEAGKMYTAEGRMLNGIPSGPVRMNPDYNPDTNNTYVCKSTDPAWEGRKPEFRTLEFIKEKAKQRFSRVGQFLENEKEQRAAWLKDLMANPKDKLGKRKQVYAAMVELIHATCSRIGGKENKTAGETTYGMSTLLVKHLSVTKTMISYDYTGKKGAQQGAHYKVSDPVSKKIYSVLSELVADKKPEDRVWVVNGKEMNRAAVNAYLKSIGIPLSIHMFRNAAGTKMAKQILAKSPFKKADKPKQGEVEKWFKDAALEIGAMLHHKSGDKIVSSTSIASYIDQDVIKSFFESLGLRKPSFLKKVDD